MEKKNLLQGKVKKMSTDLLVETRIPRNRKSDGKKPREWEYWR